MWALSGWAHMMLPTPSCTSCTSVRLLQDNTALLTQAGQRGLSSPHCLLCRQALVTASCPPVQHCVCYVPTSGGRGLGGSACQACMCFKSAHTYP